MMYDNGMVMRAAVLCGRYTLLTNEISNIRDEMSKTWMTDSQLHRSLYEKYRNTKGGLTPAQTALLISSWLIAEVIISLLITSGQSGNVPKNGADTSGFLLLFVNMVLMVTFIVIGVKLYKNNKEKNIEKALQPEKTFYQNERKKWEDNQPRLQQMLSRKMQESGEMAEELRQNGVFPERYWSVAVFLYLDYLRCGRADSIKEAINLYEHDRMMQQQIDMVEAAEARMQQAIDNIRLEQEQHNRDMKEKMDEYISEQRWNEFNDEMRFRILRSDLNS